MKTTAGSQFRIIALMAMLAIGLGACISGDDVFALPGRSYIDNPAEIVAAADWETPETIFLDIRQDEFRPAIIRMFQGEAYVLVIENRDEVPHAFTAPEFFRTIAIRKLVIGEGEELTGVEIASIGLEPGQIKELHFVPVKDGWYPFEDGALGVTLFGYIFPATSRGSTFGTVGSLIVEE